MLSRRNLYTGITNRTDNLFEIIYETNFRLDPKFVFSDGKMSQDRFFLLFVHLRYIDVVSH